MMSRRAVTFLTVLGVCAFAVVGFLVLNEPVRTLETSIAASLLNAVGMDGIHHAGRTTLLIVPSTNAAFHVLITPSCSAIASLLAFGCLAPLVPSRANGRRLFAVGIAALLIFAGNLLRITGSIAIGLAAGRGSLVLFHDWVGTMFTIIYTMSGYIVMLSLLLPRHNALHRSSSPAPVYGDA